MNSRPPGFKKSLKFCIASFWLAKSPVKSGRWAKEFPKQITASNPFPGMPISASCNANQLPSSTTDETMQNINNPSAGMIALVLWRSNNRGFFSSTVLAIYSWSSTSPLRATTCYLAFAKGRPSLKMQTAFYFLGGRDGDWLDLFMGPFRDILGRLTWSTVHCHRRIEQNVYVCAFIASVAFWYHNFEPFVSYTNIRARCMRSWRAFLKWFLVEMILTTMHTLRPSILAYMTVLLQTEVGNYFSSAHPIDQMLPPFDVASEFSRPVSTSCHWHQY